MNYSAGTDYPNYGRISGPIVMIGYGSIGRGTLPLIERHFDFDRDKLVVIDPSAAVADDIKAQGYRHVEVALTEENYAEVLDSLFGEHGAGFCVNLSVDTSSLDLMKYCRAKGVLYIDTVVEPWGGFYFETTDNAARTNYALRERVRDEKAANPGGTTAVSCCGANPGMVSWFVKEALLTLARDTGRDAQVPTNREGWAKLMQSLGVKGVHIAERDTQARTIPRPAGVFVNTWSVEGFIAEGYQRRSSAGVRTKNGCLKAPMRTMMVVRRLSGSAVRVRTRGCAHGARRKVRSSVSSSRTMKRFPSRTITLLATKPRRSSGPPATMPTTRVMMRC